MEEWYPIENNPSILTQLIKNIGVKGIQVEEILSLESLENLNTPIYGLIFLSKYIENKSYTPNILSTWDKDLFFSKQIIENVNAIQSLLAIIFNNDDKIDLSPDLKELKLSMNEMNPITKGLTITNCEKIKNEQNKLISLTNDLNKNDEDVYHFVTIINFKKNVYELDGLQEGPILLEQDVEFNNWTKTIKNILIEKINFFSNNEIKFNLFVLIPDKLEQLNNNKNILISKKNYIEEKIKGNTDIENENNFEELKGLDKGLLEEKIKKIELEINECNNAINIEKMKNNKYKEENERRQFNYTPFILEILKIMGENNIISEVYQQQISNEQNKQNE